MKKYVKSSIATIVIVILAVIIPQIAVKNIAIVTLTKPETKEYEELIPVIGEVVETVKDEQYVTIPVVPKQVYVDVGDYVEAGDVIASVDTQATQSALYNLIDTASVLPAEYVEAFKNFNIDEKVIESVVPTSITAQSTGTITALNLTTGTLAIPKTVACTVSNLDELKIKMTVDETYANKIKLNDEVIYKTNSQTDKKYQGKITKIYPTATKTLVGTSTQTVLSIEVNVSDKSALKPGYNVSGVIKESKAQNILTVPYTAVNQDKNNNEYVYTYNNNKLEKRSIKTGMEFNATVEVTEGLTKDDVIIENLKNVKSEKTKIKIKQ